MKYRRVFLLFVLLAHSSTVFSQVFQNLKDYVVKDSLWDFGFGLEKNESPEFNFFVLTALLILMFHFQKY
jgi:hypothetical protein